MSCSLSLAHPVTWQQEDSCSEQISHLKTTALKHQCEFANEWGVCVPWWTGHLCRLVSCPHPVPAGIDSSTPRTLIKDNWIFRELSWGWPVLSHLFNSIGRTYYNLSAVDEIILIPLLQHTCIDLQRGRTFNTTEESVTFYFRPWITKKQTCRPTTMPSICYTCWECEMSQDCTQTHAHIVSNPLATRLNRRREQQTQRKSVYFFQYMKKGVAQTYVQAGIRNFLYVQCCKGAQISSRRAEETGCNWAARCATVCISNDNHAYNQQAS